MKTLIILLLLSGLFLMACKDENITNNYGPEDWQPPRLEWVTPPESELRGTVGIDISVQDSSEVDSVVLYVDGLRAQTTNQTPYRFELITDSLEDDDHLLEARAWDEHGNMGVSTILRVRVMNGTLEGARLIWVPDNFERIQDAINTTTDNDTIRVRDGIYYETLNLFGKGIWMESENGPLHCTVDAAGADNCFFLPGAQQTSTLRGLRMTGANFLVFLGDGSQVDLYNNILTSDTADGLLITGFSAGILNNNLFTGSRWPVQIGPHWGTFFNNIVMNAEDNALWSASYWRNPLKHGFTLLWNNVSDYGTYWQPDSNDVHGDPLIDLIQGQLLSGSPGIDTGNPNIFDRDSTRSDIGPFGGPWAY